MCRAVVFKLLLLFLAVVVFTACNTSDILRDITGSSSPYERYVSQLESSDMHQSTAGRLWIRAGQQALDSTVTKSLPAREVGYFDPRHPSAVGYRLEPQRGEQLEIRLQRVAADTARLFADLYELRSETDRRRVAATTADDTLTIEASGNPYVLRLQPELLSGGQYRLSITTAPTLAFPVDGHDRRHVRSFFGDPRDGGVRQHHGVDIFAPRGTPVVAASAGMVTRTSNGGGLGGKTVWVSDPTRGRSFYYAHLDSVIARAPSHVSRGDTLGLVGNTGNARTTPPHLHFGIYSSGPVDPLPFINTPRAEPAPVTAGVDELGTWARTMGNTNLRAGPSTRFDRLRTLPTHTAVRLTGSADGWHRVETPDGRAAYVAAHLLTPASSLGSAPSGFLHERPMRGASVIDSLETDAQAVVIGSFDDFALVETSNGRTGWMAE